MVLTHGWPSTFYDFDKVIEPLADPGAHGGDPADAFEVIVPAMPGYAFSERPTVPGVGPLRVARLWDQLLTDLGHDRYGAHGGDWGVLVTGLLGWKYPERVVGIHRLAGGIPRPKAKPGETDAERQVRLADGSGYGHIQSTRPQTLAYGLTDSPAGLAAWIVEKSQAWSDCAGDIESRFTKDELLTTISLYWFTETIHSSTRLYYENAHDAANRIGGRIEVPSGYAVCRWLTQPKGEFARDSGDDKHRPVRGPMPILQKKLAAQAVADSRWRSGQHHGFIAAVNHRTGGAHGRAGTDHDYRGVRGKAKP